MSAQPRRLRDPQFRNQQPLQDISSTEQRGLRGATPGAAGPDRSLEHAEALRRIVSRAAAWFQSAVISVAKELVNRRISSKSSTPTHRGVTRKRCIFMGGS